MSSNNIENDCKANCFFIQLRYTDALCIMIPLYLTNMMHYRNVNLYLYRQNGDILRYTFFIKKIILKCKKKKKKNKKKIKKKKTFCLIVAHITIYTVNRFFTNLTDTSTDGPLSV